MEENVMNNDSVEPVKKNYASTIVIIVILAILAVVGIIFALKFVHENDLHDKLVTAGSYLEGGKNKRAIDAYNEILDQDSKNIDAYIGIASAYIAEGDYDEARSILKKCVSETESTLASNYMIVLDYIEDMEDEIDDLKSAEVPVTQGGDVVVDPEGGEEIVTEEAPSIEEMRAQIASERGYGYNVGQLMPDAAITDTNGRTTYISSFLGEPLYINFYTTWCYYCGEEVPDMQDIYDEYRSDINYIMIDIEESAADALWYADAYGLDIPMYNIPSWRFGEYEIDGVPTTFVLDAYGRITDMTVGMASRSWIENATVNAIESSNGN